MPNAFENAVNLATVAAKIVGADLSLAREFYRDLEPSFNGKHGATVRIPVPGAVEASVKSIHDTTTPLTEAAISEQGIDVTLSDHVHVQTPLSEGDLDLEIEDFSAQVIGPQAFGVAKKIERAAVAALQSTPADESIAYTPTDPARTFTAIRRKLRQNGVAAEAPLIAAVGADVYADLLDTHADLSADAATRVRGFRVIESTRLAADEIVGFVKPAFALVVRAPAVPDGATFGASIRTDDFALRFIRSYDGAVAVDRAIMSAFVKVQAIPLAVDQEDGTVDLVDHAGAVRVLTASA